MTNSAIVENMAHHPMIVLNALAKAAVQRSRISARSYIQSSYVGIICDGQPRKCAKCDLGSIGLGYGKDYDSQFLRVSCRANCHQH